MLELGLNTGTIIMVLIGLASVVAVAIIIERFAYFRRNKGSNASLMEKVASCIDKSHWDEAAAICEKEGTVLSKLILVGIESRELGSEQIRQRIEAAANLQVPVMEKHLSTLGSIAHISPLLGLLGTVTGNIQAFGLLGNFGVGADPGLLAQGIAEALITTAAGIVVAIPATFFYNYLVNLVNNRVVELETQVGSLVETFKRRGL